MSRYIKNIDDYRHLFYSLEDDNLKELYIKSYIKLFNRTPEGFNKQTKFFNEKIGGYKIIRGMPGKRFWIKENYCIFVECKRGFHFCTKKTLTQQQSIFWWLYVVNILYK